MNFLKFFSNKFQTRNFYKSLQNLEKPRQIGATPKETQTVHSQYKLVKRPIKYSSTSFYVGTVVSTKMKKTGVCMVDTYSYNTKYKVTIRNTKKFK